MPPLLSYDEYAVGWICAITNEVVAAKAMLDGVHESLPQKRKDSNIYILGRIRKHNVVITCLPAGKLGPHSAAITATHMFRTFTSLRFCFMVGVGGGLPGNDSEIKLGDVVVSTPRPKHNAVVQHDFGKTDDKGFERTHSLNSPPRILLNAINRVRSEHKLRNYGYLRYLSSVSESVRSDLLVDDVENRDGEPNIPATPRIFYGTMASGNQLIASAAVRDKLGTDLEALCIEMEAAGLMDDFQCLVIRGICDYSDSSKNKEWQGRAALAAAAVGKELLSFIEPEEAAISSPISAPPLASTSETAGQKLATQRETPAPEVQDSNRIAVGHDFDIHSPKLSLVQDPTPQRQISISDSRKPAEGSGTAATNNATDHMQVSLESSFGHAKFSFKLNTDIQSVAVKAARGVQYVCKAALGSRGSRTFNRDDAEALVASGWFSGPHWSCHPPSDSRALIQGQPHNDESIVVGSLVFSKPSFTALKSVIDVSAFAALSALVAIGVVGDPAASVSLIVSSVVDGVMAGLLGDNADYPGNAEISDKLKRGLLEADKLFGRGSLGANTFDELIPRFVRLLPLSMAQICATTREDVQNFAIYRNQLATIAEWAFDESTTRTLVLGDPVEILATNVVLACMNSSDVRTAVVHCSSKEMETWGPASARLSMAAFRGGTAQNAVEILKNKKWMMDSTEHTTIKPKAAVLGLHEMSLYCSADNALDACIGYLQSCDIEKTVAEGLLEALKKDAIAQFSRRLSLRLEDEPPSLIKRQSISIHYEFGEIGHDDIWKDWGTYNLSNLVANQPTNQIAFGSHVYYGYTARKLPQTNLIHLHSAEIEASSNWGGRNLPQNTRVSAIVAEVAGFVYALAMSKVMARVGAGVAIRGSLGCAFGLCYKHLSVQPGKGRIISRCVILGVLAVLWLCIPPAWIPDWPNTALGISNDRGSVLSAVLAESASLEEATTKFIVSAEVPDLMSADKPVVVCAGWSPRRSKGYYETKGRIKAAREHDACDEIFCLTTVCKDAPTLSPSFRDQVYVIPAVGFICCGAVWHDYVDFDEAFSTVAESQSQRECNGCEVNDAVEWLDEREFLKRSSGKEFAMAKPEDQRKLFIAAHGSGLKQSFISALFHEMIRETRYQGTACLAHAEGVLIIDGGRLNCKVLESTVQECWTAEIF